MKLSPAAQIPPASYILQLAGKETKQVIKGKKPTSTHKHMAWEPNYKAKSQLALNRARGNITDQVARYNRINLFYKQFQASVRISYKNVP